MKSESVPNPKAANTFDVSKLRLSQNFSDQVGVKKEQVVVPVRKPNKQRFFRVHPSPIFDLRPPCLC